MKIRFSYDEIRQWDRTEYQDGKTVDVPDELFERYQRAENELDAVLAEIERYLITRP